MFSVWGYHFERRGGIERYKKTMHGDVCLIKNRDRDGLCFLNDYFLESKRQARPDIWGDLSKAEDDAVLSGKRGAVLFATKQDKNKRGEDVVVMTRETFKKIMVELQGYREETNV